METLSKRLEIPVDEYTTPMAVTVPPDASLAEMKRKMSAGHFRHLPVLQGREVVGLVSQRDLMLVEGLGSDFASQLCASDIMHRDVFVVSADSSLEEVVFEMSDRKIGSAIILDHNDESVGIFTSTDALNALIEIIRGEAK